MKNAYFVRKRVICDFQAKCPRIIFDASCIDRLDSCSRIRVRGQQGTFGPGVQVVRLFQKLRAVHLRHLLIGQQERYLFALQAHRFSERELEVLRLIARGNSNPEIARELVLSVETVKRHVYNIFSKLEVKNRVQAVARTHARGLLPEEPQRGIK